MTNVPELSTVAYVLGGVIALLGLYGLLAPASLRGAALALPRHRQLAIALTALALIWSAWIILTTHLGPFESWKPAVYIVTPILFYLLVAFLDELLAARAFGGLLLLAANPIFYAARLWEPQSDWRYVMPVLAYAIVIVGVILVMSPYRFRRGALALAGTDGRCRVSGACFLLLGGSVLALGAAVY